MAKSLGIVTIHGMGSFGVDPPPDTDEPSYSRKLYNGVRQAVGSGRFDTQIAWREAAYSHIFERNQSRYVDELRDLMHIGKFRDLAIRNLGDPASYNSGSSNNSVYGRVHVAVQKALTRVRRKIAKGAPIIILAHSLGGHVISNYIWDLQDKTDGDPHADIAAIVTFGCNLPLFLFAFKPADVRAIRFPGGNLAPKHRLANWWRNYYDKDDPLGYPLSPIGKGYADLAAAGALTDRQVNAGGLFTSWNLFSHIAYWADRDISNAVAAVVRELIDA